VPSEAAVCPIPCRRTFGFLPIQDGESLTYIKEQLGHSSIKITVDVYGHLVPGANRQAVNRLPSLRDRLSYNAMIESPLADPSQHRQP
jgi:integrase